MPAALDNAKTFFTTTFTKVKDRVMSWRKTTS